MPVTEKRFQTRMPYHVHDKLVQASEFLGATLNQFIIQSALEKAVALFILLRNSLLYVPLANIFLAFSSAYPRRWKALVPKRGFLFIYSLSIPAISSISYTLAAILLAITLMPSSKAPIVKSCGISLFVVL